MPSFRSTAQTALAAASLLNLEGQVSAGHIKSCPSNVGLSCHNTTAITDTCCTNSPGGLLLQTQFWDTDPETGPLDSWTVHGLWPDNCDGTYQQYCDPNREYTNITQILESYNKTGLLTYMNKYWKDYQGDDESFWEHEWNKHGTCISTLDPDCYVNYTPQEEVVNFFSRTVKLFKTLPSYKFLKDAGIVPSTTTNYSLTDVQAALKKGHGEVPTVQCSEGAIDEIWYYYNTKGTVAKGTFYPAPATTSGDCPDTVQYLPKVPGTAPTAHTSTAGPTQTTATSSPTSTGAPFAGKGYINVANGGKTNGCLISAGTWYTTGNCATYTATSSGDGFTLSSSKGKCAVDASTNALRCGTSVATATVFGSDGNTLTSSGSSAFYANEVAQGSTQEPVYIGSGAVPLVLSWQSV